MIKLNVGSQRLVLPLQEVFCAPDANGAIIGAGGQVLAITAEINAGHIPSVGL